MSVDHYENFPVASLLLPARLRPAVTALYGFARSADDNRNASLMSEEALNSAMVRLERALGRIERAESGHEPMFERLAGTIARHNLPMRPFYDLLSAFKQDVEVTRYANYEALLDYCARSANPVGLLMLHLYGQADEDNVRDSDAICSALQIINFLQDVAIDERKERIYIPMEDLTRFAILPAHMNRPDNEAKWRAMMKFEVDRARALMLSGAPLALRLKGRIGLELRMVVQGGLRILEAIEEVDYDVFLRRPKLEKRDWFKVFWRALRMKPSSL